MLSGDSGDKEVDTSQRRKLDTTGAADYLGLGKSTLDKMRLYGGGPAYFKVGNRVVYDPADLDTWLSKHRRTNTSQHTATVAA